MQWDLTDLDLPRTVRDAVDILLRDLSEENPSLRFRLRMNTTFNIDPGFKPPVAS